MSLQDPSLGPCVASCLGCGSSIWERQGEDFLAFLERYQAWKDDHEHCAQRQRRELVHER
jgi:hypothetical protein